MSDPIKNEITLLPFTTEDGYRAIKDQDTNETYVLSDQDLEKCGLATLLTGATTEEVLFEYFMMRSEAVNGLAHQSYVQWEAAQDASEATIN